MLPSGHRRSHCQLSHLRCAESLPGLARVLTSPRTTKWSSSTTRVMRVSSRARLTGACPRPVVTLPRTDNRGFAAGVNLAAARSRAPFLLLLNPDTIVEGPVVRTLETWLTSHPDVGVAGARVLNRTARFSGRPGASPISRPSLGGRTAWLTRRFPGNWLSRRNLLAQGSSAPVEVDWLSGACLMTRREIFDASADSTSRSFCTGKTPTIAVASPRRGFAGCTCRRTPVRHLVGASAHARPGARHPRVPRERVSPLLEAGVARRPARRPARPRWIVASR